MPIQANWDCVSFKKSLYILPHFLVNSTESKILFGKIHSVKEMMLDLDIMKLKIILADPEGLKTSKKHLY